jgi:NADPH2:quinone reductase
MRAWLMNSFEGIDKLQLAEASDPQPGPGEVVLEMAFASLNPADAWLAAGQYPAKPRLPHVLGRDGVGKVVAVGTGVTAPQLGDRVAVLRGNTGVEERGTLAEKTAVSADHLVPIPAGWSQEETAAAPLVFLTAWQALTQWRDPPAPPAPGSVLLVTGASGGVGTAAVLLGKSMGLTVVALSRSQQKGQRLRELGADFVFDPAGANLQEQILNAIAPQRVDIVVDNVAGPLFSTLIFTLGYGGCISVVGRSDGPVPSLNTASLFFRRNRIGGVSVSDYTAALASATWNQIVEHLNASRKRPVIDGVFAFTEVKQAFARLRQGPMGKVLIKIGG